VTPPVDGRRPPYIPPPRGRGHDALPQAGMGIRSGGGGDPASADRSSGDSPSGDGAGAPVPPATRDSRGAGVRARWSSLAARGMRPFWVATVVVLGVQLAGLLAYSAFLYHRFDLTDDFGTYVQAWWLIGHGHLNPVDTIQAPPYPFWQSHFELAMWPIALVGRLWPSSLQLVWLQDVAVVATEATALVWAARVVEERMDSRRSLAGVAALVALVWNPWWYQVASFDVHFEVLGLPFVVWSAYALWRGRPRVALVAGAVALLFGDVVTVIVACVAIAGLLSRRVRKDGGLRWPGALGALALGWLALIALAGGNRGSGIVTNYGYLVGAGPRAGSLSVLRALVLHPARALQRLFDRRAAMGRVVASAGLLGVVTPWGLLVALGVLGPAALNANPAFLTPTIAFQTVAVVPFVFVGTVMVLLRVAPGPDRRAPSWRGPETTRRRRAALAVTLALGVAALSLVQSVPVYESIRGDWWRVDAATAAALRAALPLVPPDAEVVASQGVIGRFAERRSVYPYLAAPQAFPVTEPEVYFVVVPDQGIESVPPAAALAAVATLTSRDRARVVLDRSGVFVLAWHPPPGVHAIVLP